ncbi:hypothetical protein F4555_000727 [Mobiluncus mulieris]|uniref:Uncharacterized protein n=1 Tax=Mobiluncus mulieris TaxID=2052 RepID=A0A8G2HUQ2_9ACTO|nr:hypothetical protein [Mobiluncus mulieris]MBB5845931.1 hypothetical protein [Mobiluncus mulieris]MCV0003245.1 hypothetical protein [Mobiluncus mulieris]NMW62213.1 hypothetical protein [Mobiluncus mulieris]PNL43580.1 hypothetical protein CEP82_007170 [Mobiluncus mulieris]SPX71301.1 Uncharacterised protein [Mobiluncus mulieris]
MSEIAVHPRILRRHPELSSSDVVAAMRSAFRYKQRPSGEWVAVGLDGNSRLVEMVYLYNAERDLFFVYHAMTPPSRKTLLELDLERR